MNKIILALSDNIFLLFVAIVFVLLFVIILKVLRQQSFFRGTTALIVSICVSLLCVIGLCQPFVVTEYVSEASENSRKTAPDLDFILIPYAALALAILLSPLLWLIAKMFRGDKYKERSKRFDRSTEEYAPFRGTYKPSVKRDEDRFTK